MTTLKSIHHSFVTFFFTLQSFPHHLPYQFSIIQDSRQRHWMVTINSYRTRFSTLCRFYAEGKKKPQRFCNCCDPLGLNMTAVLTAGKSRLLTAQQKCYRLLNLSESVHEQNCLRTAPRQIDLTALLLWIVYNHELSAGWISDLGIFPAPHYSEIPPGVSD